MIALLADIGGTKTQLALMDQSGEFISKVTVPNNEYPSAELVIRNFLADQNRLPEIAILAIAGPVDQGIRCQMTNLPWLIDGEAIKAEWNLKHIVLLNDLQATAWGMTAPSVQRDFQMLRGSRLNFDLPVIVISPGTGLGQACILPYQNTQIISATEGGHKSIAPFNPLSAQLIYQHWQTQHFPPSWENWFSGSGFQRLYQAMFPNEAAPDNQSMGAQALADPNSHSGQCLQLFTQAIYAESGNLVLQYLAWGGVIITGGIPPKLEPFFSAEANIRYIESKNEYTDRLREVPVALCKAVEIPLIGAAQFCLQNWMP